MFTSTTLLSMTEDATYYADGFDECIIGVDTEGDVPRVVYDKWAMVLTYLSQNPDCTWEEAVEFLEYNVWYAYVGKGTPHYLRTVDGSVDQKRILVDEIVDQFRE